MIIHVECKPDEALVGKLGFTKKQVEHHFGKSRVFAAIKDLTDQVALVDEDPMSATTTYEDQFISQGVVHGVTIKLDPARNNRVLFLQVKLEDWIIGACKANKLDITRFNLPDRPNELHEVINNRLQAFHRLLDELLRLKNPHLSTLSEWLHKRN